MYCTRVCDVFTSIKCNVFLLITFDGNLPEVTEHNDKDEDNAAHCYRDEQSHLVDVVVHIICGGVREKKKLFSYSRHSCRLHYSILVQELSFVCGYACVRAHLCRTCRLETES